MRVSRNRVPLPVTADPFHVPQLSELAVRFEKFHAENPHVYTLLVRFAREWVDRTGAHRLGVQQLVERARWELAFSTSDPEFKISNSHAAFYARLIMWQEVDLDGLFTLRPSAADDWMRIRFPAAVGATP